MSMLVPITTLKTVGVQAVGGKAHSLIRLAKGGANVPPGLILTTQFFASWFDQVQQSEHWQAAIALLATSDDLDPSHRERLANICEQAKKIHSSSRFRESN